MKKFSLKNEILVVMMLVVVMLAISTTVLATGTSDSPVQIPVIDTSTNTETANETTTPVVPTTNVETTNPTTNTNGSTYQNTALPQTGDASDYAIFLLIVVAVVIAVYAYRKVRDYNI